MSKSPEQFNIEDQESQREQTSEVGPTSTTEKAKKPNLAEAEVLTPYNEEFIINNVDEGQDVLIGIGFATGEYYLRGDFSEFNEKLGVVTPEKIEELFNQIGKLQEQFPNFSEDERRQTHLLWRVARITKNLLGEVASETKRNDSFDKFQVKGERFCIKPLSQCKGESVCSEYSMMAQHILKKLGVESSIVIGAFSPDKDELLADRHTFLTLENGELVYDPTHTSQQQDCWPPKIFKPEKPLNLENLQNMSTEGEFGHKIVCEDLITKEKRIYGSGGI